MAVSRTIDDTALRVWEEQQLNAADRYGYFAFQVIGILGITASVTASLWTGRFIFEMAYFLVFLLSLLFLSGGIYWRSSEKPTKQDLQKIHRYEIDHAYDEDGIMRDVAVARRERLRSHYVNSGNWADRR